MALTDADRLQMTALALMKYSTITKAQTSSLEFVSLTEALQTTTTTAPYFVTVTEA